MDLKEDGSGTGLKTTGQSIQIKTELYVNYIVKYTDFF